MLTVATVRILDLPYRADKDFDYFLPEGTKVPPVGQLLLVPFGQGNHPAYAVLTAVRTCEEETRRLKTVLAVLPEDYRLTPEILKLCFFLREHTLASVGDAVRAAFPAAALGNLREEYFPIEGAMLAGNSKKARVLALLREMPGSTLSDMISAFGDVSAKSFLSALCREGLAERRFARAPDVSPRVKKYYSLVPTGEERALLLRGDSPLPPKHRAICLFLQDEGEATEREISDRLNVSTSPIQTLVKRGILRVTEREEVRNPYLALAGHRDTTPVSLSPAQERAYEEITAVYDKKEPACVLLHGVTGSGKTKVMIRLLDRVLSEGRQAILLVPEIALTPQTVGIFCARYGERVAVLHSSLSVGERFDAYRRILHGETDLVIGTRSAVFAPLSRLSLILVDEEHEHTYKSDAAPRYHTRDVAAFRSAAQGALTLLASATPSIESYYKAKTGRYTLVSLTERYGGVPLPKTEIVDMREELRAGNTSSVSLCLSDAISETVGLGKQAILFLNRRGYHHTVSCRDCGEPLLCPHCSVSFTLHTGYTQSYLLCHACGTKQSMPDVCPSCGGKHLAFLGAGTQKAEAEIASVRDGIRVLRMDADTTASRDAYERILGKFRHREADVLLGTQMVTKGHDFPDVALSGVLLADASLYTHDFRAAERTFSLLTQVIGRAGRAKEPGRAIVQTLSPMHPVIQLAAKQDYPAFYEEEIALRRALAYPPFCDIAMIGLSSADEGRLLTLAAEAKVSILKLLSSAEGSPAYALYGPLEAPAYRVAGKYRLRISVKCRLRPALRRMFGEFLCEFGKEHPDVAVTVDFNPTES